MPTVDERLKHVTLKVERAKEHVTDLERHIRTFLSANPYKVGAKKDPQTRKLVYYVVSVEPTPPCLATIAGDAIQNLASALDHLAYQIVCSDTGDKPPNPFHIYFPIRDTFDKYEAEKRGKMKGAADDTFLAIDKLKPYKGGNDLLWTLYALNRVEKHRLLLTVGSHAAGVELGTMWAGMVPPDSGVSPEFVAGLKSLSMYVMPADSGFPLKAGFELCIGAVDQEPDPNQKFRFDVALSEPGVLESESLLATLHQMTTLVEGIITALTPRLK